MNEPDVRIRETLAQIVELANKLINDGQDHAGHEHEAEEEEEKSPDGARTARLACTPKTLPKRLLIEAANTAREINPANAVAIPQAAAAMGLVLEPMQIAVLTAKYWGPQPRRFTVSFMETTEPDLRARIISHMNAWSAECCMSFVETRETGDIRISREPGGFWSYLGTDILHIPTNLQTMNLEEFTMSTPESEYKRVIRHETGHTLGFPHEHMRKELIDRLAPERLYPYCLEHFGWDKRMVDQQILTPLDEKSLMSTPSDETSIMCYQLSGDVTRDGKPILGGIDINDSDYAFARKIYPKSAVGAPHAGAHGEDDWGEAEDVKAPARKRRRYEQRVAHRH